MQGGLHFTRVRIKKIIKMKGMKQEADESGLTTVHSITRRYNSVKSYIDADLLFALLKEIHIGMVIIDANRFPSHLLTTAKLSYIK